MAEQIIIVMGLIAAIIWGAEVALAIYSALTYRRAAVDQTLTKCEGHNESRVSQINLMNDWRLSDEKRALGVAPRGRYDELPKRRQGL